MKYAMIEATIVRAHHHAAGAKGGDKTTQCIGKSKGGLTSKIHASCDALGNPTAFYLTPGQMHDLRGSDVLLARILADVKQFLADKAYDAAKRVLDLLEQHDVEAVIPHHP